MCFLYASKQQLNLILNLHLMLCINMQKRTRFVICICLCLRKTLNPESVVKADPFQELVFHFQSKPIWSGFHCIPGDRLTYRNYKAHRGNSEKNRGRQGCLQLVRKSRQKVVLFKQNLLPKQADIRQLLQWLLKLIVL